MAAIRIDQESVTIALSTREKVEAVHGDVRLARSWVLSARVVPDGIAEVHGLKAPGTGLPGVIKVGTWRGRGGTTFAVCHGEGPAVVMELAGAAFDRVVVTVDDPEDVVRQLG